MSDKISSWLLEGIDVERLSSDYGVMPTGTCGADSGPSSGADAYGDTYRAYGNYVPPYSQYSNYYNYSQYTKYSVYNNYYDYSVYYNYYNYSVYYNYSNTVSVATQPVSQTIELGNAVTFSITISGTADSYQWYKATSSTATGTAISGATSKSYTFTPTAADHGTYYYCVVKRSSTTSTSSRASLSLIHFKAATLKVCVGKTLEVGYVMIPATATVKAATSANTACATVDSSGNVTGKAPGTVNITLESSNGLSRIVSVEVLAYSAVNELETVLFNIAEAARAKKSITNKLYPNQLANALTGTVTSKSYTTLDALMTDVILQIKTITGYSNSLSPIDAYKIIWDTIVA